MHNILIKVVCQYSDITMQLFKINFSLYGIRKSYGVTRNKYLDIYASEFDSECNSKNIKKK